VETEFGLIKDLRIIANRNLKDMVIIDNSALSFGMNVNNGIPILPFYDNVDDEELRHLTFYLNCLMESKVDDITIHNEEAFGLLRLAEPR
jgi:CTD small phosphatase-like protein 2